MFFPSFPTYLSTHKFRQFLQYLLLTPTYINILNVYAFCNTHDITWGTKGDDKAPKLGNATVKGDGKVTVNIPQDDGDLNAQYDAEMAKIANKAPKETKIVSAAEKQEDYYKGFRSSVVLVWIFCNFALAAVVLNTTGLERLTIGKKSTTTDDKSTTTDKKSTIYMAVVLWSVAGLSLFRFCGAMWFLVVRLVSLSRPCFSWVCVTTWSSFTDYSLTRGNDFSFEVSDFGRWASNVTTFSSVENDLDANIPIWHSVLGTWRMASGAEQIIKFIDRYGK